MVVSIYDGGMGDSAISIVSSCVVDRWKETCVVAPLSGSKVSSVVGARAVSYVTLGHGAVTQARVVPKM